MQCRTILGSSGFRGTFPIAFVLGVLFLFNVTMAVTLVPACGGLSNLLDIPGETYTLTAHVSSNATCFYITAPNVVLNCAGFNISYAQVSSGYAVSIYKENATVANCTMVQSGTNIYSNAVNLDDTSGSSVQFPCFNPSVGIAGDTVYLLGGNQPTSCSIVLNQPISYNVTANTFLRDNPPFPGPVSSSQSTHISSASTTIGDSVYIAGGRTSLSGSNKNTLQIYNITNNSWTIGANMSDSRAMHVGASISSVFYIIGGDGGYSGNNSSVIAYNSLSNSWSTAPADLPFHISDAAIGVVGGKLYVIGGRVWNSNFSDSSSTNQVWEYNSTTDAWTQKTNMTSYRERTSYGVIGDSIYVYGGSTALNDTSGPSLGVLEIYNTSSDSWTTGASGPINASLYSGAGINGKFYFFYNSNAYEYTPGTNTWATKVPAYGVTINPSGATIRDNRITTSQANSSAILGGSSNNTLVTNNNLTTTGAGSYGIGVRNSVNFTFSSNRVNTSGSYALGVYGDTNIEMRASNNIINTSGNYAYGIAQVNSNNSRTLNNTIGAVGVDSAGIIVQDVSNNTIANNRVNTSGASSAFFTWGAIQMGANGIALFSSSDNTVENNTVNVGGYLTSGVILTAKASGNSLGLGSHRNIIRNNTVTSNSSSSYSIYSSSGNGNALAILWSSNNNVTNNTLKTTEESFTLLMVDSVNNTIASSTLNSSKEVIQLLASRYNTLNNNTIISMRGDSDRDAVSILSGCYLNNITNNNISALNPGGWNSSCNGITVGGSSSGTGITLVSSGGGGSSQVGGSDPSDNLIENNTIYISNALANHGIGFLGTGSNFNRVRLNNITVLSNFTASYYGIVIRDSMNPSIINNSIIVNGPLGVAFVVLGSLVGDNTTASQWAVENNTLEAYGKDSSHIVVMGLEKVGGLAILSNTVLIGLNDNPGTYLTTDERSVAYLLNTTFISTSVGKVVYPGSLDLSQNSFINRERLKIEPNKIAADAYAVSALNAPAQLTLYNVAATQPSLKMDTNKDGIFEACASPRCNLTSYVSNGTNINVSFNVSSFYSTSNYTAYSVDQNNSDPDLRINVSSLVNGSISNPTSVGPGATIAYTVSYNNSGNSTAKNVSVTGIIPLFTMYISGSNASSAGVAAAFSVDQGSNWLASEPKNSTVTRIKWNVGDLVAGASGTVSYTVKVFNSSDTSANLASGRSSQQLNPVTLLSLGDEDVSSSSPVALVGVAFLAFAAGAAVVFVMRNHKSTRKH